MASKYAPEERYLNTQPDGYRGDFRDQTNGSYGGNFKNSDQDRTWTSEGNGNNYPYRSEGQSGHDHIGGSRGYQDTSSRGNDREYNRGGHRPNDLRDGGSRKDYNGYNQRESGGYYPSDGRGQNGYQERTSNYRGQGGDRRGNAGSHRGGDRGREGGRGKSRGGGRESNGPSRPNTAYIPNDQILLSDPIPQGELFYRYHDLSVEMRGENVPSPLNTFQDAQLCKSVQDNINKSNYKELTPVQKNAIPCILAQRELMVCAETGSGKTAAFLLPIISMLSDNKKLKSEPNQRGVISPSVLVLVPTRELAIQIYQEAQRFSYGSDIHPGLYYGGTSISHQNRVLTKGCHILVATPGRLLDCLEHKRINLSSIKFFVIDEADRMLDIGFFQDVDAICHKFDMPVTGAKQTILFSATLPKQVQELADRILTKNRLFLIVGKEGKPAHNIKQIIIEVPNTHKLHSIVQILKENNGKKVLVFVENKRQTDLLASQVCQEHMQATSIHGSRMQQEREQALFDFKSGKRMILIATGVAARGLDIRNVDHVINYDLPLNDFNEYVHRIGRTGRIGNSGLATSFFNPRTDSCIARKLVQLLASTDQDVPDFLAKAAELAVGTEGLGRDYLSGTSHPPNYHLSPGYGNTDERSRHNQDQFGSHNSQSHPPQQSPPRHAHQPRPHQSNQPSEWD